MKLLLVLAVLAAALIPQTAEASTHLDVPYRTVDGITLRLDIYHPADRRVHPVVVVVHGGKYIQGDKSDWAREGKRFASNGFVAVVPNYRLSPPGGTWHANAPVEDIDAAISWVRANAKTYRMSATSIGVLGGSNAATIAEMVGTMGADRPNAVVAWSGLANFRLCSLTGICDVLTNYVGCTLDACPDSWDAASPYFQVSSDDVPTSIFNSQNELTPVQSATQFHDALLNAGVPTALTVYPGTRHSRGYESDAWAPTVQWFRTYLGAR